MPDDPNEDYERMQPPPEPSMPMYEETYNKALAYQQAQTQGMVGVANEHRPTITELLHFRKSSLERELELVNAALKKAEENSGAMALMDAVAKTRVHG